MTQQPRMQRDVAQICQKLTLPKFYKKQYLIFLVHLIVVEGMDVSIWSRNPFFEIRFRWSGAEINLSMFEHT